MFLKNNGLKLDLSSCQVYSKNLIKNGGKKIFCCYSREKSKKAKNSPNEFGFSKNET